MRSAPESVDPRGAVTLDQVASAAGVSRATASRAINGGNRVSPAARSAVETAVRELGYRPNLAARSLVTRRTDSIAVVVPEPDERVFADPFFARTLSAVNRVLAEKDLQLVLLLARPGRDDDRLLRYLGNSHVDGVLVVSHHRSDGLSDRLAALQLHAAFVGRPWTHADKLSFVDTDNVEGGRLATQVLLERGCSRIGTVSGPADMTASLDRLEGWRSAMREAGQPLDVVEQGDFTEEGGARATRALLERHGDLDGLFVASDLMAAGALRVLAEAGRRVPDDVAVVGYDDLGVAERTTPPLTTVSNPTGELATRATRMLLESLAGGEPATPMRLIVTPTLVRRASA
ncbi:LacI family DNA-binding transcriptional regulator [Nocardioides daphniae]|uniref:LacI family DNA-binding transcriptional regulator n=1 Tax=Nocardioides daphniae TaxID=402297 RepID=UPI0019310CBD|nr:LacI family DNA-binding transcriptional regulator [Nocardioides daphniae]